MKNSYICTEVMNKTDIKYYSIAVALATASLAGVSCDREEDDIWSQSSAERLEQAQTEDRKILYSAPNGWQMLYFCNGQEQGYNFLMKFDEHGGVMIATRNPNTRNAYTEEASMYDVLADDGPVLSFSTYNSLFHRYADPDPEHTQGSDGVGSAGDYEFNIMTIADTMIYLRGRRAKLIFTCIHLKKARIGKNISMTCMHCATACSILPFPRCGSLLLMAAVIA